MGKDRGEGIGFVGHHKENRLDQRRWRSPIKWNYPRFVYVVMNKSDTCMLCSSSSDDWVFTPAGTGTGGVVRSANNAPQNQFGGPVWVGMFATWKHECGGREKASLLGTKEGGRLWRRSGRRAGGLSQLRAVETASAEHAGCWLSLIRGKSGKKKPKEERK